MKTRNMWSWACVIGLALAGCDDPPEETGPQGMLDGGTADGGDAAAQNGPAFAVVSGDFTATSVSLLDREGNLLADDYVHSGSVKAGLATALSGDVELPKQSGEPGVLVLLDRLRTDVVTRIRLADGAVLGQLKAHTPPTQQTPTSFSSNPQDYVRIDEHTAWLARSEPNLDPAAPAIDRGNDLLRIDPSTMTRSDERIDLSSLNATATPSGGAPATVYARPTRLVRLGRTLVVGLSRSAFDYSVAGDGAVALVDLDSKAVTPVLLPGLKNCTGVDAVPNDADTVLVTCLGDFDGSPRDTAGLVLLGVERGAARIEHAYRAKDDPAPGVLIGAVVALGGTRVIAASNDFSGATPDVLAVLDVATGARTELASVAPGKGRFGAASAFDASTGLLLVPDATLDAAQKPTAGVRRFRRAADGTFSELPLTRVSTTTGLAARAVYPL